MAHKTRIVYSAGVSLDGYIADVNGGVDWLHGAMVPGEGYGLDEFFRSIDAVLMGSRTYEKATEMGGAFGSKKPPCWVFSKRPIVAKGATVTADPPAAVVADLSSRGIQRAWLMGGGKLASSFLAAGLIDEISIGLMPVVLGAGLPLFDGGIQPTHLSLIRRVEYKGGALGLTFTPRRPEQKKRRTPK